MSLEANCKLAEDLAVAAEAGKLDEIATFYHPDATIWINTTNVTRKMTEHLGSVSGMRSSVINRKWRDIRITPFEGGYIQQWRVTADGSDGKGREMAICMVCQIEDGKIVKREEYHDAAQLASLRS